MDLLPVTQTQGLATCNNNKMTDKWDIQYFIVIAGI